MAKIFILGATGYLGGTILDHLSTTYPALSITAMARDQDKANLITAVYPSVRTVIGNLDSSDIIIPESSAADIIITAADCDHPDHVKYIYEGMAKNTSGKPIYLIHTSGTGVLIDLSFERAGESKQSAISDKVWDDVEDIEEIYNLPMDQMHKPVESQVQAPPLEKNPNIKYAIVSPPLIYGVGSGPVNKLNTLCPWLFQTIVKNGKGFTLGKGDCGWSNVHVGDLADLYALLVGEALKEDGGKATWGRAGGWYFAENGMDKWCDVAREVTRISYEKGYLKSTEVEGLGVEKVQELNAIGPYVWGTNSVSKASRARRELGWEPKRKSMWELIPEDIDIMEKKLGMSAAA
ncbi:hypothetical protein TWF718_000712 [Orbilia javanica]|uniref:NAD-dependent epimerase/dehydratase domain-containing protein n=1 Tax=Orbilia javanica TaxID=47235 RepID=A0AAN8N4N4_9PEZI